MLDHDWRAGTLGDGDGQCVEVRRVGDTVEVRDSEDRSGPFDE